MKLLIYYESGGLSRPLDDQPKGYVFHRQPKPLFWVPLLVGILSTIIVAYLRS